MMIPHRLSLLGILALALSMGASADDACNDPHRIDERKQGLGPGHHPVGRPLPATDRFNTPGRCIDGIWFFDLDNNGQPDAGEPRLFGSQRMVDCGSCHGESAEAKSPQSASVFLRQDASRLCLVCHAL